MTTRTSMKKMAISLAAGCLLAFGINSNAYAWDYYDGTYIWSFHWINSNTCAELDSGGGRAVSYGINYRDGHGDYADMIETGGAPIGTISVPTNVCINTNGRVGDTWFPVKSLGRNVFNGCGGLTDISIPDCITNIGASCFKGCIGLTTIHLPERIGDIGTYAFQNCSNLTSLTLPQSLTQIGRGVFQDCTSLNAIELPAGVEAVPAAAFQRCVSLASISMPNGITSIDTMAFRGCVSLEYVIIPESVTEVGRYAFAGCVGLKKAFVPISLKGKLGVVNKVETAFDDFSVVQYYDGSAADIELPTPEVLSVIDAIDAIGEVLYTAESKDRIVAVRAAYDALTDEQKELVSNYETLTAAEIAYGKFETAAFDQHKEDQLAVVVAMLADGDSVACAALVASAESTIAALVFDHTKTIDANKGAVDAIVTKLAADLAAQREADKPGYDMLNASDIKEPFVVPNAVTLMGAAYDGDGAVGGIVELKLGKVNAKKKTSKVSGTVTTLDGKKHAIKTFNLTEIDGTSPKAVSLEVKDFGMMLITIGGTQFAGSMGKYHVQSADVGGNATGSGVKAYVDAAGASLPAGALEELLPDGEPVVASGGKWKFAKAAGVKWAKPKKGASQSEYYDEASGKDLVVDTSAGKTNLSGLKLTYTPKKGTFKGSFKVYALEGEGKARKLKKYTVKVSGVVVGGVGYGTATCKTPAVNWAVTVR